MYIQVREEEEGQVAANIFFLIVNKLSSLLKVDSKFCFRNSAACAEAVLPDRALCLPDRALGLTDLESCVDCTANKLTDFSLANELTAFSLISPDLSSRGSQNTHTFRSYLPIGPNGAAQYRVPFQDVRI